MRQSKVQGTCASHQDTHPIYCPPRASYHWSGKSWDTSCAVVAARLQQSTAHWPTLSASVTLLNLLTGPFVRVGVIQNNNLLWRVLLQGLCLVLPPKQELINIKRFEQLELEGIGACDSGIIPNCFPNMERLSYNSVTVGRKDCKVES